MSGRGRASGGRGRTGTQPESVEKAEVTVNAAATSDKKFSGTADARYQTKRSNSQSSREAKPKPVQSMPKPQGGSGKMGASETKRQKKPMPTMPPLEPNPLSEENIHELQRKLKETEKVLDETVNSNEKQVGDLSEKLELEKEKVLQVEKDKRELQEEKESLEEELRKLKEQLTAHIEVPSVACNDKDSAVSDEDYESIEQTTTSAGAAVLPMYPSQNAAVGEQRHHEHHQIEFQKSVEGSSDRISSKSPTVLSKVEELQARLLEMEAAKDAAEQEQQRLAEEVIRLDKEKREEAIQMQKEVAKDRRELEKEVADLNREVELLKVENKSFQGLLDGDSGNKGSFHGSAVEAKLAEASVSVSQSVEPNKPSSFHPSRSKGSSIRRHVSYDAALSVSDDTHSSDWEASYCFIDQVKGGISECDQGLSEQTTGASKQKPDRLHAEMEKLKAENAQLQELCATAGALQSKNDILLNEASEHARKVQELQEKLSAKEATTGALQTSNEKLLKEASNYCRKIHELQANSDTFEQDCTSLKEDLKQALEESEARKQHEQILVQQLNERMGLEKQLELLNEQLASERKKIREMEDVYAQAQMQLTAYEEDFKAERSDRENAHDKFADAEKKWMDQLTDLNMERDKLAADVLLLQDQIVAGKRERETTKKELEAAKSKLGQKARATEEHFQTVFMKKDEEIHRLNDEIRGLKPIAERYRGLFAEHKELESKFAAMVDTNRTVQRVVHEMQSEKAAADSRLKELTLVVNQVTGENDALNQQNVKLKQQIESFERMFSGMNSKSQALEAENSELREAICLPDIQITPRSSLRPPSSQTEGHRSLPSPTSQRHGQQPHVRPPQPNQPEWHRNPGEYQLQVGTTYGHPPYGQQNPQYGKPCNEQELIIRQDPPGPYDANDETDSPPLSNGAERYSALPKQDPHSRRPAAQAPAWSETARAKHRDAFQPQFPHSSPSIMGSDARAWPDVENRPVKYPPAASERYQAATQPPMDASKIRPQNSNSSTSETSLSLPLPLTNRKPDIESSDPSLSGFEANRRYIGEDINREIRHEARRYKEDKLAVEPANAAADVEEWPFDPNLTCNFCGTMFRRGQIREFRYHVDECTARSMEGTK